MGHDIGKFICKKRKELGYTQQHLAERLSISFQAVSRWENGSAMPDIALLPQLALILNTSVDALVGYSALPKTDYDERYSSEDYYWGITPNSMCYEIMRIKPPVRPYRVLDIGCGEGKDAVFLAKNGYVVSAFDIAEAGLEKARKLAEDNGVQVDFFKADMLDYEPNTTFDIIYSSGAFHYLPSSRRAEFVSKLKEHTSEKGIHAINVFVEKPFIDKAPDLEEIELQTDSWLSGELFTCYHDWLFHQNDEVIFDCNSSGIPHKHCMNILIAEKIQV